MAYRAKPARIAAQVSQSFSFSKDCRLWWEHLPSDDLRFERAGRRGPRPWSPAWPSPAGSARRALFPRFIANLFLGSCHRRRAWRVRVVNEHGCLEIFGRKHLGDVSKVRADLLDAGFVVGVFCGDDDFSPVLELGGSDASLLRGRNP